MCLLLLRNKCFDRYQRRFTGWNLLVIENFIYSVAWDDEKRLWTKLFIQVTSFSFDKWIKIFFLGIIIILLWLMGGFHLCLKTTWNENELVFCNIVWCRKAVTNRMKNVLLAFLLFLSVFNHFPIRNDWKFIKFLFQILSFDLSDLVVGLQSTIARFVSSSNSQQADKVLFIF